MRTYKLPLDPTIICRALLHEMKHRKGAPAVRIHVPDSGSFDESFHVLFASPLMQDKLILLLCAHDETLCLHRPRFPSNVDSYSLKDLRKEPDIAIKAYDMVIMHDWVRSPEFDRFSSHELPLIRRLNRNPVVHVVLAKAQVMVVYDAFYTFTAPRADTVDLHSILREERTEVSSTESAPQLTMQQQRQPHVIDKSAKPLRRSRSIFDLFHASPFGSPRHGATAKEGKEKLIDSNVLASHDDDFARLTVYKR